MAGDGEKQLSSLFKKRMDITVTLPTPAIFTVSGSMPSLTIQKDNFASRKTCVFKVKSHPLKTKTNLMETMKISHRQTTKLKSKS